MSPTGDGDLPPVAPPIPMSGRPPLGVPDGELMHAVRRFLGNVPEAEDAPRLGEHDRDFAGQLLADLGLTSAVGSARDPLAGLQALAEISRSQQLLGPDPDDAATGLRRLLRRAWHTDPDPAEVARIDAELRRLGLANLDDQPFPTPRIDPDDDTAVIWGHDTPVLEPIAATLTRLVAQFGLRAQAVTPTNLPATIARLRFELTLRAGAIEALRAAAAWHDSRTEPVDRLIARGARDQWARVLDVDPATLDGSVADVVTALREDLLIRTAAVADLADAAQVVAGHHDNPEQPHRRRYNIEVGGRRTPVDLVVDGTGRWRMEPAERLGFPPEPTPRTPEPSRWRRWWTEFKHAAH
ncbi:hypothetical protein, partial [Streptomyces sp. NPDC058664]|uniref:hypothetical protein n=1 Tax=Streptomyces sp. NPDC058664 TaxID=3346585 RepID=UPI003652B750